MSSGRKIKREERRSERTRRLMEIMQYCILFCPAESESGGDCEEMGHVCHFITAKRTRHEGNSTAVAASSVLVLFMEQGGNNL